MTSTSCYRTLALLLCVVLRGFASRAAAQTNVQGQWTTLSTLMPINPIHVALLPAGQILVVAGSGNCSPAQSGCPSGPPYGASNGSGAGLFDPVSQNFTPFTVPWDMFCNGMVLLPDGRVLIAGGTLQYGPFLGAPNVSIFDPSTNTFTNVQNMANGRWYPTLTTLPNGQVMTFAGIGTNGKTNTTVEIYDVNLGWSQPLAAHWTPPTYPRMHVLPTGTVFYSSPGVSSALFDPIAEGWTLDVASTNYASTRTYGTSVLLPLNPTNNYDSQIMIMGGNSPATNTTEIIDMGASTPAWVSGPNMSEPRIEMNAVILPNGEVLALGGSTNDEDTSTLSLNADLYNPSTNTFTSAGANASQRLYHSVALLLPDATVWVAGGNPHQGTYNNTMEVYQPAYLFDGTGALATRPSITSAPSFVQYGSQFAVQTPDAASIASVALVRFGAVTHAFNTDQRLVWTSFISGNGSLTVTAPPNGSIAPPGYYMLFLLNSAGVPSVSTVVQLGPQPDFDITATPSLQVVSPGGGSTSYNVELVPMGFSGTVSFGASGLPSGASAVFNPASLTGQGTSVMTVSTSASTPNGIYSLTINATGGTLVHQPSATLQIGSPPAATPALNPLPGTYVKSQLVAISDSTPGATIYFTTDGSMPTTSSLAYISPISVSSSSTIRAMAAATGYNNSFVTSGAYIIQPPAATPSFSPAPGTYPTAQSLIITDTTSGAIIYYTTDGSTPTTSSSVYGNPINLSSNTTVKAIVAAQGYTNSNVASGIYNVRTALPKFSPSPGTYPAAQSVTIADATNGATIYYTTDGSTPTTSSTVYSSPFSVSSNATIRAIAAAPGYTNSNVAPGIYNIRTALPSFGLAPGTYPIAQSVSITDVTSGAIIYYTTDGTTPTTSSSVYGGPINVSSNTTVKAIAGAPGYINSNVSSGIYNIRAALPSFSPAPSTYPTAQSVSIADTTNGATIYYTTDGSIPTTSSSVYNGPISVSSSSTIKTIAAAQGYTNSNVASGIYNIRAAQPSFSPAPGTYVNAQPVSITDTISGATIYYTTDGTIPTTSSSVYNGPINFSSNTTVKAIAAAPGYANSNVTSGFYKIQ